MLFDWKRWSPGLSVLVSVGAPKEWQLVNHHDYDGKVEDNFRGTALQLSLTGDVQPIAREKRGTLYGDAFFVEPVISVHDHGKWIGDVDIFSKYRESSFLIVSSNCPHRGTEEVHNSCFSRIRAVDGWPEFIDPPLDACVIRASNNWVARLAVCAIVHVQRKQLLICKSAMCWECIRGTRARSKSWFCIRVMLWFIGYTSLLGFGSPRSMPDCREWLLFCKTGHAI
jgi:hypothetical protein